MTAKNTFAPESLLPAYFIKPMLLGAGIALLLIIVFLSGVDDPNPAWPKFWMARPLIVVPLAGATGGAIWALLRPMRQKGGWIKVAAYLLGIVVFIVGLWMGAVLGLDGTLWN
jgi:hypothetical protein